MFCTTSTASPLGRPSSVKLIGGNSSLSSRSGTALASLAAEAAGAATPRSIMQASPNSPN